MWKIEWVIKTAAVHRICGSTEQLCWSLEDSQSGMCQSKQIWKLISCEDDFNIISIFKSFGILTLKPPFSSCQTWTASGHVVTIFWDLLEVHLHAGFSRMNVAGYKPRCRGFICLNTNDNVEETRRVDVWMAVLNTKFITSINVFSLRVPAVSCVTYDRI